MIDLRIDQFVEIKAKALAYNPHLKKLGRLSGTISSVNRLKEELFYTIDLDSESLNKLPDEYIAQNIEYFIESSEIHMCAEDLIYKGESEDFLDDDYEAALRRLEKIEERLLGDDYLPDFFSDDDEEDTDSYEYEVVEYVEKFLTSSYFQKLTNQQKELAEEILLSYSSILYHEFGVEIGKLGLTELQEIFLNVFPTQLSYEKSFYKACLPVLIKYFEFLGNEGVLEKHSELVAFITKNSEKLIKLAADETNWRPSKKIAMRAIDAGVDISSYEEMSKYINELNSEIEQQNKNNEALFDLPDYGRNEKVTVKYLDGTIMMNVKFKKVMEDIQMGECIVINGHSDN